MRERFKQILANDQEEYKVHSNHPEVSGDVDGTINDHRDLLKTDQACVEQIMNVKELDKSNDSECNCDLCADGKPTHDLLANMIMRRIIKS